MKQAFIVFFMTIALFSSSAHAEVSQIMNSYYDTFSGAAPTISVGGSCPPIGLVMMVKGNCEGTNSIKYGCGPTTTAYSSFGKLIQHYANVSVNGTCSVGNCTAWLNDTVTEICSNTNETLLNNIPIRANCSGSITAESATIFGGYTSSCETGGCGTFGCNIDTQYSPCTKNPAVIINGTMYNYTGGLINDTTIIPILINQSKPIGSVLPFVPGSLQRGNNVLTMSAQNLNKFNYSVYWYEENAAGGSDKDNDGYYTNACSMGNDCDDNDPGVNPGMSEIPGNRKDDNCDGLGDDLFINALDDIYSNCQYFPQTRTYYCTNSVDWAPMGKAGILETDDTPATKAYYVKKGTAYQNASNARIMSSSFSIYFDSVNTDTTYALLKDDSTTLVSIRINNSDPNNLKATVFNSTGWTFITTGIQNNTWYNISFVLDEAASTISLKIKGESYPEVLSTLAIPGGSPAIKWIAVTSNGAWLDNMDIVKKDIVDSIISQYKDNFELKTIGDSVLYRDEYGWENITINNDISLPVVGCYTSGRDTFGCTATNIVLSAKNKVSAKSMYAPNNGGPGGGITINAKNISAISLNTYGAGCGGNCDYAHGYRCGSTGGGPITLTADEINIPTLNANDAPGTGSSGGTITVIANKTLITNIYSEGAAYRCSYDYGSDDGSGSGGTVLIKSNYTKINYIGANGASGSYAATAGSGGYIRVAAGKLELGSVSANGACRRGSGGTVKIYADGYTTLTPISIKGCGSPPYYDRYDGEWIYDGGPGGFIGYFTDGGFPLAIPYSLGGWSGPLSAPGTVKFANRTGSGFFIFETNLISPIYKTYQFRIRDAATGKYVNAARSNDTYLHQANINGKYISAAIGWTTPLRLKLAKDYYVVLVVSNESNPVCELGAKCKNITIPFTEY